MRQWKWSKQVRGGVVALTLVFAAVGLVACRSSQTPAPATAVPVTVAPATATPGDGASPLPTPGDGVSPLPTPAEGTVTPDNPAVSAAIADLMGRLNVAAAEITVVSVEPVAWRDSSLGCPEPGMMYAQVITPGSRVVLESGGTTYEYHTSQTRAKLCSQ